MIPKTCGDLRTKVRVQYKTSGKIPGVTSVSPEWIDIGNVYNTDPPKYKYCLWVGVHGNEAFSLAAEVSSELATLTFRYDKRIKPDCRVIYDDKIYDIISVDHIRKKGQWTEVKVRGGSKG